MGATVRRGGPRAAWRTNLLKETRPNLRTKHLSNSHRMHRHEQSYPRTDVTSQAQWDCYSYLYSPSDWVWIMPLCVIVCAHVCVCVCAFRCVCTCLCMYVCTHGCSCVCVHVCAGPCVFSLPHFPLIPLS